MKEIGYKIKGCKIVNFQSKDTTSKFNEWASYTKLQVHTKV